MRVIQQHKDDPNVYELAWMWLPTFIGQNTALLEELDGVLVNRFPPPVEITEGVLDVIHEFVIKWICEKLNIPGLDLYLKGLEHVGDAD